MEMTAGNGSANMNSTGIPGSNPGSLLVNMNVGTASSQLQQRAAAAAQYLNSGGQRQPTSRDVQLMLDKNDAAMRAWSYLHAQQPSKHLISEHKAWAHKCSALRQQIGARLEVLASLADKQIAREDASGSAADKASSSSSSAGPKMPPTPPPVASAGGSGLAGTSAAAKKPSRAKATKPKVSATNPAPVQVRQMTASVPVSVAPAMANPSASNIATAAALGFPDAPMPVSGLPGTTQSSVNPTSSTYYATTNIPQRTAQPAMYQPATVSSTTGASTTSNSTTIATTAQAFSTATNYGNNTGYMGGMGQQQPSAQTNPYMNNTNFMMNNAMNIAAAGMMNSQYMAMQMQNQMPMAMNTGAMYNPNMFASTGAGYMGMNTANQMQQANPFNAPFQMQQGGAAGYNPAFNMGGNSAQMMGQMGGFQPMQSPQMMFNPMAFNMTPAQQPQQQQQFQQSQMQPTAFNNNLPSQQQQQSNQQQPSQQSSSSGSQPQSTGVTSSPFLDDDTNLFEGFSDDAFLSME